MDGGEKVINGIVCVSFSEFGVMNSYLLTFLSCNVNFIILSSDLK